MSSLSKPTNKSENGVKDEFSFVNDPTVTGGDKSANLNSTSYSLTEHTGFKHTFIMLLFTVCAWALFTYDGLVSAIQIWSISEIFQHCFFVIPGAFYLLYQERSALAKLPLQPTFWALPILTGQIAVYVLGLAGDIQILMHLAAFTMLPTLIWAVIGNRAAYHLIFPLSFMLFAIPVGEELIPVLQEVTADISVYFSQLTGVPLYRSGLFIEIPEGRFLVAEACSGISFFIASIVIGNLYAYMNLRSAKRRVLFVALSIVYPILANAVRVYGIILTGHLTDMQHAVGADHLIYGWFFFSIVIISLILLGELFRRGDTVPTVSDNELGQESTQFNTNLSQQRNVLSPDNHSDLQHTNVVSSSRLPFYGLIFLLVAGGLWGMAVTDKVAEPKASYSVPFVQANVLHRSSTKTPWQPSFSQYAAQQMSSFSGKHGPYEVFQVSYDGAKGELVGFQNKLYSQKRWTLEALLRSQTGLPINVQQITSVNSEKRIVYFAYWFAGKFYTSKTKVKLVQTFAALVHQSGAMRLLAVSFPATEDKARLAGYEQTVSHVLDEFATGVEQLRFTNIETLEQRP